MRSERFADFKMSCNGNEWMLHRGILASASKFLSVVVTRDFKVGAFGTNYVLAQTSANIRKEKLTGVLELPEEDPRVVDAVLEFIYTGTYNNAYADVPEKKMNLATSDLSDGAKSRNVDSAEGAFDKKSNDLSETELHIRVNILADKWDMPQLHKFSLKALADNLELERGNLKYFDDPDPEITGALELIFQLPQAATQALRVMATRFCVDCYGDWPKRESNLKWSDIAKLKELAETHEPLAFRMGIAMRQDWDREQAKMRSDQDRGLPST